MKYYLSCIILFTASSLFAQQKEGTIVYERKVNMHRTINNPQVQAMMPEFRTSKHALQFAEQISLFTAVPEEEAPDPFDGGGGGRFVMRFGAENTSLFKNYAEQKQIETREIGDRIFIIQDNLTKQNWKLSEETKSILGHTCRKATTTIKTRRPVMRMMTNNNGNTTATNTAPEEIEQSVVAWYAEDIIAPVGPDNFGQLPGAILELDIDNGLSLTIATEIKSVYNKKELKEPTKGKKVTREEFAKLMQEMMSNMGGPGMRTMRMGN